METKQKNARKIRFFDASVNGTLENTRWQQWTGNKLQTNL